MKIHIDGNRIDVRSLGHLYLDERQQAAVYLLPVHARVSVWTVQYKHSTWFNFKVGDRLLTSDFCVNDVFIYRSIYVRSFIVC